MPVPGLPQKGASWPTFRKALNEVLVGHVAAQIQPLNQLLPILAQLSSLQGFGAGLGGILIRIWVAHCTALPMTLGRCPLYLLAAAAVWCIDAALAVSTCSLTAHCCFMQA